MELSELLAKGEAIPTIQKHVAMDCQSNVVDCQSDEEVVDDTDETSEIEATAMPPVTTRCGRVVKKKCRYE